MAKTITRARMIESLINNDFDLFNQGILSLDEILRNGFIGYNNREDKEIEQLYNELGIPEDLQDEY